MIEIGGGPSGISQVDAEADFAQSPTIPSRPRTFTTFAMILYTGFLAACATPSKEPEAKPDLGGKNAVGVAEYPLSGEGTVSVYKPFGPESYVAVVEMDGVYPEEGKIARNAGRDEFALVLDGSFQMTVNGQTYAMNKGDRLVFQEGDTYTISGNGRCLVLVQDDQGGKTEVLPPSK